MAKKRDSKESPKAASDESEYQQVKRDLSDPENPFNTLNDTDIKKLTVKVKGKDVTLGEYLENFRTDYPPKKPKRYIDRAAGKEEPGRENGPG